MIEKEKLEEIVELYGSPLYIFHSKAFVDNYIRLEHSFKSIYSKYIPAYSYKTNYTPRICQIVKELGGYAEVVSDMEYQAAKAIGYDNSQIIYNGPFKGEKALEHLLEKGIINIDNLKEVERLCEFCKLHSDKKFEVGLRVNIDVGQTFISRFGIDTVGNDLAIAVNKVAEVENMSLIGFHCHVGQSRTLEAWARRTEIMLALVDKYFGKQPPKYIDMGSGMFAEMNPELACQFGSSIPIYEEYANIVASKFAEHYASYAETDKPILFTEPGTTVISSFVDFVGQVDSIKKIKGKTFVTMDCSKDNIGDICKIKKLPIYVIGKSNRTVENADIVGYTCLEHDVMYENYSGMIQEGNYIVFENVGGYSNVSKPPFISPNCPMIELNEQENTKIIKRRENFEDVFQTYIFG